MTQLDISNWHIDIDINNFSQKIFSKMKIVLFIFVPKSLVSNFTLSEDQWHYQTLMTLFCFQKNECNCLFESTILKNWELLSLIINKVELYECFMKRYDGLMDRLLFIFSFVNCLFFRYWLEFLKNEFSMTNVLCHLLFCSRSPSTFNQCRLCSRFFFKNANYFVLSVKYHFSHIFANRFSNKEIESLFVQERKI